MKILLSPQSTFLASVMLVAGQDKVDKSMPLEIEISYFY